MIIVSVIFTVITTEQEADGLHIESVLYIKQTGQIIQCISNVIIPNVANASTSEFKNTVKYNIASLLY